MIWCLIFEFKTTILLATEVSNHKNGQQREARCVRLVLPTLGHAFMYKLFTNADMPILKDWSWP